jgi:hypothetical protein
MNIERNRNGAWVIYELDQAGYLMTQTFYDYTLAEAKSIFRQELEARNATYITAREA